MVIQSKDKNPNTLNEKSRKRGATEFQEKEDAIQADEWLEHIGDVFETVICDNKQRVVLTTSMLQGVANVRWKSMSDSYKVMPNATIWETFQEQFHHKFTPDHVYQKKEEEFVALKQNQMIVATYVHIFLQLSKFSKDLVDTEEKKVKRFIGGLHLMYEEHVVMYKWAKTFDDAVDRAYTIE